MADTTSTQRAPASTTPYLTYSECYNNEALYPFSEDYCAVMSAFQATTGREAATRATALYEQVFATSEVQPHIYLMLTQDAAGEPALSVVHHPHCHIGRMGTNENKQDVAFLGDMRGLLPPNVIYFPEETSVHSGSLTVPRAEMLDQAFADSPRSTVSMWIGCEVRLWTCTSLSLFCAGCKSAFRLMTCKRSFVCRTTSSVSVGKTASAKRITVNTTQRNAPHFSIGVMSAAAKEARCDG
jgi:hypothetical protein